MSSKSRIEARTEAGRKVLAVTRTTCLVASIGACLGGALGGCSDIYYDRRETVSLAADDHIAANQVEQMVDPWPRYVGDKNIAFNGERMQAAVQRYRHNRVIPPVNVTTTSMSQAQAQQAAASANSATGQTTTITQGAPAAAVK
jgi:hypothetical protein